jgi:transposase
MPNDALPDDPETLKAMLLAARVQANGCARSSRSGIASAAGQRNCPRTGCCWVSKTSSRSSAAQTDGSSPADRQARPHKRRINRGPLPAQRPRIEIIVDIDDKTCPHCQGELHRIGGDGSERLDIVPAQFRVLVTWRPNMPAGLARTVLCKPRRQRGVLCDHLPLYRQTEIYAR